MNKIVLSIALSALLIGCSDQQEAKKPAPDIQAGKAIAEKTCIGCHGMNGEGAVDDIPNLAGQAPKYLVASLMAYREGKREHAALQDMTQHMTEADIRNVAYYYASLPAIKPTGTAQAEESLTPFEKGKKLAKVCSGCHGADGNSEIAGVPSLAGQQPIYLVTATQAYLDGKRNMSTMTPMLDGLDKADLQNIAAYYAAQEPKPRKTAPFGSPALGEPLSANCGGCHGSHGVSTHAATPSLAGQDAKYLLISTKAYRDGTRHNEMMTEFVDKLSDKDIENIAAFYSVQTPKPAEELLLSVHELTAKCDRCHNPEITNPTLAIPNINGQHKAYLAKALRRYHDGERGSSMMHNMSEPYSYAIIDSLAAWYANQPPK